MKDGNRVIILPMALTLFLMLVAATNLSAGDDSNWKGTGYSKSEGNLLKRLAANGNSTACLCLSRGLLVLDPGKARFYLKKAAKSGDAEAEYAQSIYELNSLSSFLFGKGKGLKYLQDSANKGYEPAQSELGRMHEQGRIVERDLDKAEYWYQRAAMQGDFGAILRFAEFTADTKQNRDGLTKAYAWCLVGSSADPSDPFKNAAMKKQELLILEKADRLNVEREAIIQQADIQAKAYRRTLRIEWPVRDCKAFLKQEGRS